MIAHANKDRTPEITEMADETSYIRFCLAAHPEKAVYEHSNYQRQSFTSGCYMIRSSTWRVRCRRDLNRGDTQAGLVGPTTCEVGAKRKRKSPFSGSEVN